MADVEKPVKKAKKFKKHVTGVDGTIYAGTAHQSLLDALDEADGQPIYARSETHYDPETRAVIGNRWVPVAESDMPVGGAIPGEWKRVSMTDVEDREDS